MIGFSNIAEFGFSFIHVILPIIIGILTLIIFVKRQNKIENPLVNLIVLKNKYFVYGTVFAALLYFMMCGINVMVPLFVQNVAYYSPTESGLISNGIWTHIVPCSNNHDCVQFHKSYNGR